MERFRRRYIDRKVVPWTHNSGSNGISNFVSYETIRDENRHPTHWPPEEAGADGMIDRGGPLLIEKRLYSESPSCGKKLYQRNAYNWYDGPIYPKLSSADMSDPQWGTDSNFYSSSDDDLREYGTVAISRCAPTNPHASVATLIGELYRDGLPAIPGVTMLKGKAKPSSVGGEYLNYQFGIAPTISDLKKLAKATRESEKIMAQYYRDSGKPVRRRYRFREETTTTSAYQFNQGSTPGPMYNVLSSYTGTLTTTTTLTVNRWFSGRFTYHAPEPRDGFLGELKEWADTAEHVYGLRLDPSVAWNLLPWSWAVDWFSNMGDAINNASMSMLDGLVLWYGYIMEHSVREVTYTLEGLGFQGRALPPFSQTLRFERKRRLPCTPFGFGVQMDGLSGRQLAILAALGLSQGGGRVGM